MNRFRIPGAARCRCIALVGAVGAFLPLIHGQTAPAASATTDTTVATDTKKDTVVLSPFEVSTDKDSGYAAGNTLSGGRVNTPLAISPASISVMTKEFMEDFAITDMNQAAQWTLSMDPAGGQESGLFGGNRFETNFRGAGGSGNYPTRDGMIQFFVADSYNSERFDFQRGPNAQMYGTGAPGGIQGSSSKQPRFNARSFGSTFRADNYGSYRATVDISQGFERFGIRINALHQNTKAYQDGTSNKQNALTVASTFRISDKTQIRAQYEKSSEWNILYRKTYAEQASIWNRTTTNLDNTAIASPALLGLGVISQTNDRLVYNFGTNSLLNYKGVQYQTVGLGYQIPWHGRPDLPNFKDGISKSFFLGPIDSIADRDNNTRTITIEHRFAPNLFSQLTWTGSDVDPVAPYAQSQPGDYRIDVNRLLPTGQSNPNYLKAYSEFSQNSQYQQNGNDEFLFLTNYNFEVKKWFNMKQSFSLNFGVRYGTYEAWNRAWRWTNNPTQPNFTNNVNTLNFRIYYDQPRAAIAPLLNAEGMAKLDPTKTWRNVDTGFAALQESKLTNGQINSRTDFFNERLSLSWGFRRDKSWNTSQGNIGFDATDYHLLVGAVNPATGVNEVGYITKATSYRTSKNAGIVTYPFPQRWKWLAPVGLVANYSENFQTVPTGNPLITGERPDTPYSRTIDFGLRYSIPGGVAYATLTHYSTDQIGQLGTFGSQTDIRNIWTNLGYTDPALTQFGPFRDTSDRKLDGWEFELTANPSPNLTFTANYAHPSVRTVADSKDRRTYYAAHIDEWQAGAAAQAGQVINGHAILDPAVIASSILNIENSFNGSTAGTLGNGPRHRINLAGSYRFTEGKVRGLGINAGVNYRGHSKAGSRDARLKFQTTAPTTLQNTAAAWDYLWTPPTWDYTMGANYTRRFGKYQARFQVNITNPFDNDKPRWSSYSVINAGQLTGQSSTTALTVTGSNPRMQVRSGFTQLDPRKITFTTTLNF